MMMRQQVSIEGASQRDPSHRYPFVGTLEGRGWPIQVRSFITHLYKSPSLFKTKLSYLSWVLSPQSTSDYWSSPISAASGGFDPFGYSFDSFFEPVKYHSIEESA